MAFGRNDRQGGRSTEISAQSVGLYPDKYGVDMLVGEDLVEASIFTNRFIAMDG